MPQQATDSNSPIKLNASRTSASDLEVGGDLAGFLAGATRYVTFADLQALPQSAYTVTDDSNFNGPTKISGVPLAELARRFGADPGNDLVIAICDDKYHAYYSKAYIAAHQPLLVLEINGKPPSGWPKDSGGNGFEMGPFLISHPRFVPSYSTVSHPEEAQIPWGVVRLEFRNEKRVMGAISPRGPHAGDADVIDGFALARQNCFRCHNSGAEGGEKAGISWPALAALAAGAPQFFAAYVRNPQAQNKAAKMEGSPDYDDATMRALIAYFDTFAGAPGQ